MKKKEIISVLIEDLQRDQLQTKESLSEVVTLAEVKSDSDISSAISLKHTDTASSQITTHASFTGGVHGAGAGTLAKVSDISYDGYLSSTVQDAVSKRHSQGTDTGTSAANFAISSSNAIKEGDSRLSDARTPLGHNQDASTITTGTLDGDRLPGLSVTRKGGAPATGTPSGKYLKDDGTWATIAGGGGGISVLKKTADQIINGTTWQDITDLTFAVLADTDYAFKFYIVFRSAALTTGFRFSLGGPAGVVDYFMTYQTVANSATAGVATWLQKHSTLWESMTATLATVAVNQDLVCMIEGRIKVGATGTLAVRVASELPNNDLVIQKGSWGMYF